MKEGRKGRKYKRKRKRVYESKNIEEENEGKKRIYQKEKKTIKKAMKKNKNIKKDIEIEL